MAKYNVQERLAMLTGQAESLVASEMLDAFRQELLKQFKSRKDHIEDWQNLSEDKLNLLSNRLRVIAAKASWTEANIKDIALICSLVWNEMINGN
jgi:hypothetical protein